MIYVRNEFVTLQKAPERHSENDEYENYVITEIIR